MTDKMKWKIFEMFLKKHRMYAKWIREPITGGVDMPTSSTRMVVAINSCGFFWERSSFPEKCQGLYRSWVKLCSDLGIRDEIIGTSFVDRVKKIQEKSRGVEW
jgi:hypothetical protein